MKVYSIIVAGGKQFKGFSRGIKQSSNASMEVIFGDSKTKKYSDMLNMKALVGIRIIFIMGKEFE